MGGGEYGVGSAEQNADALAWGWVVGACEERREGSGSTGFDDDAQFFPEAILGVDNGLVRDEDGLVDEALGDGEHHFADAIRRQGIGCDAAGGGVDGMSGGEGVGQGGRSFGFYADDADAVLIPGGDATDEAAASASDQQ